MPEENISLYAPENVETSWPELSAEPVDKRPLLIGIGVAAGLVIVFGLIGWLLFIHPVATAILRDISIIFMGLGIFIIILLLIALIVITTYLVLKVNDLVRLIDREIRPVLNQLQGAATRVSGTTTFLGDKAVKPVITTAGHVAAVQAIFRSLFRGR